MTPGARIQAAIEILDQIGTGEPAEKCLTGWARRSRFAGSKDRAAVRDHVFSALRSRNSFAARGGGTDGRAIMLGAVLSQGLAPDALFHGQSHAPTALSDAEWAVCHAPAPKHTPVDLPDWIWAEFQNSLGPQARDVADALRRRAPVFLRVNTRKATRDEAIMLLSEDGVTAEPHDSATTALIVQAGERAIRRATAYTSGIVELQDGASQALVERLPLRNGQSVLDFCAGGGGKTLAMAAKADLHLSAHDANSRRMADIAPRATRAGVKVRVVKSKDLRALHPFDLILCDVPCSGSGAWRRAPDGKWTLSKSGFETIKDSQSEILKQASGLVVPGGYLCYATCSVLNSENQDQVDSFLDVNAGWVKESEHRWLPLQDTDGFYVAVLRYTES